MAGVGDGFGCLLDSEGTVSCFGNNTLGQCNVPPGVVFSSVSCGAAHACGVTTGKRVLCWGSNDRGQAPTTLPLHDKTK